ncbi:phiSA1p31-related protein [Streptomyces sp. NPDC058960]|uniref:phiSA1p31-related protein n=1 Tax=Streptomyces sp. NPDC058960 TaxID=3346679 RepID=UPI0036794FEF
MAFKVGDKVTHRTFGAGEVAFGPYLSAFGGTHYLMAGDGGKHYIVGTEEGELKPAAKFKVGDKVRGLYSGALYTIEAGPFFSEIGEWYATKDGDGHVDHNSADCLTAVEPQTDTALKPGDVVRIPRDDLQGADVKAGDLLVVKQLDGRDTVVVHAAPGARQYTWYFEPENVTKVDADSVAVVDNVAYDLFVKYRDRDGDFWRFERRPDGEVRGNCAASQYSTVRIDDYHDTLAETVREYGPLTRV